ncbi:MAG: TRAP transporter small permease subunit [Cytophagales bacterium]|nr:TRAP transporter small permease subunit [Rhizobacter sp.]
MTTPVHAAPERSRPQRLAETVMAAMLAVMALAVFINVVLRYGFGSGIAASEELSRLLFVWMVFVGATVAYPLGEHMAFTSLLQPLQSKPMALKAVTRLIHALVVLACVLVGWGAWQQVVVGMGSKSVVMGYSAALLPLPAFLCSLAIGVMALVNFVRGKPIDFGHEIEVE